MSPVLFIIGGPNGSGKTTVAEFLLKTESITRFINADSIAKGIAGGEGSLGNIEAGRIMLESLKKGIEQHQNISFETTLSGKTWSKLIRDAKKLGYEVYICFVIVNDPLIAVSRVQTRHQEGGHFVPSQDIIRRFYRSLDLFFNHYKDAVNGWYFFDNSDSAAQLIAYRENGAKEVIIGQKAYEQFKRLASSQH